MAVAGKRCLVVALSLLIAAQGWAAATVANSAVDVSAPSPLLAIDQNRSAVVDRVIREWGAELAKLHAGVSAEQLRELLSAMRADHLLAASLAGNLEAVRNIVATSLMADTEVRPSLLRAKTLGDADKDVVYVPVTPCRLVETRTTYPAVHHGAGAYAAGEVRTYTLEGGNGVCLTQLPAAAAPVAVQVQVYGIPTAAGSGDIEVLPEGGAFGSTATLVFLGSNAFTSSSTTARANLANKQISVQVRGSAAHVAIDVVGYFRAATFPAQAAQALACVEVDGATVNIVAGGTQNAFAPSCTAGYTMVEVQCRPASFDLRQVGSWSSHCNYVNEGSFALTAYATARCCRVPAR